jgi:hypothetical protein
VVWSSYLLESNTGDFRVKKGNVFMAAADSGLFGFILPTDEEFTVIDPYDDRLPPSGQIILRMGIIRLV